ncbi:DNA processing protein DprA [Micromonospora craterilacus]|uniref:DNA processing protein DprA n=1 Tax=Micromonospora craterilacus TaxID=1655439 RepID=A0A2W2E9B5_9ACTN|nr:DNA-processing protein DprA [Micromonospora craterilacus]PZG18991.1 DNA processing protein DprA [Micromonospora craterilacus]
MPISEDRLSLLALCKVPKVNWYLIAREAQRRDGLARLLSGELTEESPDAQLAAEAIREARHQLPEYRQRALTEVESGAQVGARLITVLDQDYPQTLRLIFNLPPFLFVRGAFAEADLRSVAVVGTREATEDGVKRSGRMARLLVEEGVTVVSGLARGIDTAAHWATLSAGGRTLAVIGTGIRRCYPAENRELAEHIARDGAIVSQFWPDAPGATYTFPRRNVTMSGIAQGTVVIEASKTSGAKMQARLALEHGKKVFLLKSLTESQEWARKYVATRSAIKVDDVADVVKQLNDPAKIHAANTRREQLEFQF